MSNLLTGLPKGHNITTDKDNSGYRDGKKELKSNEILTLSMKVPSKTKFDGKGNPLLETVITRWNKDKLNDAEILAINEARVSAKCEKLARQIIKTRKDMENMAKDKYVKLSKSKVEKLLDFYHVESGKGVSALMQETIPESAIPSF
jgi:hypothetical protein